MRLQSPGRPAIVDPASHSVPRCPDLMPLNLRGMRSLVANSSSTRQTQAAWTAAELKSWSQPEITRVEYLRLLKLLLGGVNDAAFVNSP